MANPVKIKVTVDEVLKHTDSVVSYRFIPQGRVPRFRPGQFLHLALDDYTPDAQWPESRVFSIASSPSARREGLEVTLSVKGDFTRKIFQTLEKGAECWLKLPYGEFLFPENEHLTLIAGGVGITPYLSLLKQMLVDKSEQAVALYYGIRSADHYLFSELLNECAGTLPGFKKNMYCEDGSVPGETGLLDIETIFENAPDDSVFYLSGPPLMIDAFKKQLSVFGVEPQRIRVDDWE